MPDLPPGLVEALREAHHVAALTGSGISAESGVPTFRDARTGLWARCDPQELATPEAFARDPDLVWKWYAWRRGLVEGASPNPGHVALAQLERFQRGRLAGLKGDRVILLETYAEKASVGLEPCTPEERHQTDQKLRLVVLVHPGGVLGVGVVVRRHPGFARGMTVGSWHPAALLRSASVVAFLGSGRRVGALGAFGPAAEGDVELF